MSEFTVCRTLDTHPMLRYCLVLDDTRIAGGKPDYRGNNILIRWRTKETYGPIDAMLAENAKLRKAVATAIKVQAVLCRDADSSYCRDKCPLHRPESNDCLACDVIGLAQELGIEANE